MKSKYNKHVYWSCESELCNVTIGGENVYASVEAGLDNLTLYDNESAQAECNSTYIAPSSEYTDKTLEILYCTIESLQQTVQVLRDELKSQNNLFNELFAHMKLSTSPQHTSPSDSVDKSHRTWASTPDVTSVSTPYPTNNFITSADMRDVPTDGRIARSPHRVSNLGANAG